MTTTAAMLKKGDVIRTVRPCTSYMSGPNHRVIGYQDAEVKLYVVEKVFAKRNRVKVAPHPDSPSIAYNVMLPISTFPGTVEKVA